MRQRLILSSLALLFAISSCMQDVLLSHHWDIARAGWDRRDTLSLTVDSAAMSMARKMALTVRVSKSYGYRSLVLVVSQKSPSGLRKDTLSFDIMKEKSNMSTRPVYLIEMQKDVRLARAKGPVELRIYHAMRQDVVSSVNDIEVWMDDKD